jgi:DNA-binding NarL/FixJ family response regulator
MERLRVVLAEDHEAVRDGLRLLFETRGDMEVVQGVSNGPAAIEATRDLSPDVVVLDLSMPGMNGVAVAREIKAHTPGVAVVVLTRHSEYAYVQEVFAAGADAYVLKQSSFDELLRAVKTAASRGQYLDPGVVVPLRSGDRVRPDGRSAVTDRELSVLRLAAVGRSNKDIAAALNIAVKTVEVHKSSAMRKLGLRDRSEMLRFAIVQGWLHDE